VLDRDPLFRVVGVQTAGDLAEKPLVRMIVVHDGRYALITAGAVEMQGGIPIKRGSEIVGAIGVSGGDSSTDVPIAEIPLAGRCRRGHRNRVARQI
jgi:Haem degrading protein HbpS-like